MTLEVPLEKIRIDWPWDRDTVLRFAKEPASAFPPIKVSVDFYIIDGVNRFAASVYRGDRTIAVEVIQ